MSYYFRIPVAKSYVSAIGRAAYNFAYLEWGIVWVIDKLRRGYANKVRGKTAGDVAKDFRKAVTSGTIADADLEARLLELASSFAGLVERRNGLLHGIPTATPSGEQRLRYSGKRGRDAFEWSEDDILKVAEDFELAAIEANDIFHKELNRAT